MKIEKIIIACVLVVVIFFAIIALFIYKTSTPSNDIRYQADDIEVVDNNENNQATTTASSTPQFGLPNTDTHSALDDCIELKSHEAAGKQYEPGSLIVSFFPAMNYETAIEGIRLLGLSADTSASAKENFATYHWLPVSVPTGQEFKWQCNLEASEGIKATNLNVTFKLRQ